MSDHDSHAPTPQRPLRDIDVYLDPRTLRLFALGVASGFPWVLIGSMLTLWLKDAGLSRADIGYAGAIFAAYAVNFVWSPLVDQFKLPWLGRIGQRKSWIVLTQAIMLLACLAVANTDPSLRASATVLCCLLIAIASATQDIAIDAFRVDSFAPEQGRHISAAAAMATAGWWTGYAGIGGLALYLSDLPSIDWAQLYLFAAAVFLLFIAVICVYREPDRQQRDQQRHAIEADYSQRFASLATSYKLGIAALLLSPFALASWGLLGAPGLAQGVSDHALYVPGMLAMGFGLLAAAIAMLSKADAHLASPLVSHTRAHTTLDHALARLCLSIVQPIQAFFSRNTAEIAVKLLLFIFLFKIGEAFLGRMSIVFYKEIGFSNTDIAYYSKFMSWLVTIAFSLLSGWLAMRFGIVRALLLGGLAMAASNLMFAAMAWVGPNKLLFASTIIVDGFTTAWSTVVFVAFISSLCQHAFSATQYALLASLGTLGRTLLASSSGQLVDFLNGDWAVFFILTALMVLPALAVLLWLRPALSETNPSNAAQAK